MIVGFNHNVSYKGVGFHVQTEDSGVKSPQLVTLLYHGGTIIASKKTVYADILKVDNLNQVVEDLAKEQHKGMLRSLTQGELDERILALKIPLGGVVIDVSPEPVPDIPRDPEPVVEKIAARSAAVISSPEIRRPVAAEAEKKVSESAAFLDEPLVDKLRQSKQKVRREPSLDDLIFAYLSGADEC